MLTIRPSQMDTFRDKLDAEFHERLAAHLHKTYAPARDLEDDALAQLTRAAVARAREYGFVSERSIALFASYFFEIRVDFDLAPDFAPWVKPLLTAPGVEPDARLRRIYREARQRRQLAPQPSEV